MCKRANLKPGYMYYAKNEAQREIIIGGRWDERHGGFDGGGTKAIVVGFRVDLESGVNTTAAGLVPRVDLTATGTNAKVVGFNADFALGSGVNKPDCGMIDGLRKLDHGGNKICGGRVQRRFGLRDERGDDGVQGHG
jgi:hypothetical protein